LRLFFFFLLAAVVVVVVVVVATVVVAAVVVSPSLPLERSFSSFIAVAEPLRLTPSSRRASAACLLSPGLLSSPLCVPRDDGFLDFLLSLFRRGFTASFSAAPARS
jgi:hypothetical protein